MNKFSPSSLKRLSTCNPTLQFLFEKVLEHRDCTILEGHRNEETQNELHRQGKSHLKYPRSKHNHLPSRAVDVCPYPVDWNDRDSFIAFGNFVLGVASQHGIKLRWGGDWNGDGKHLEKFFDGPHFELVDDPDP